MIGLRANYNKSKCVCEQRILRKIYEETEIFLK